MVLPLPSPPAAGQIPAAPAASRLSPQRGLLCLVAASILLLALTQSDFSSRWLDEEEGSATGLPTVPQAPTMSTVVATTSTALLNGIDADSSTTFSPVEELPGQVRTATAALELSPSALDLAWLEPGDRGWIHQERHEALAEFYGAGTQAEATFGTGLSCTAVAHGAASEYKHHLSRNDLGAGPKYGMPWFYHDEPSPICGRVLMQHLIGPAARALVLRVAPHFTLAHAINRASISPQVAAQLARISPDEASMLGIAPAASELPPAETVIVEVGARVDTAVWVEECGSGTDAGTHVLVTARLISASAMVAADVGAPDATRGDRRSVAFTLTRPGRYYMEVKVVHLNGTADDPRTPLSLGVIGIRANNGGRKAFMYNAKCDAQRHVVGSPIVVVALPPAARAAPPLQSSGPVVPLCVHLDATEGSWVRVADPGNACASLVNNPNCLGDATWITDAGGYNNEYLWVPNAGAVIISSGGSNVQRVPGACRFEYWNPAVRGASGPTGPCVRASNPPRTGFLYFVGDSVMREYAMACNHVALAASKLRCLYANIRLEGQHYSRDYAISVANTMASNVVENDAAVFVTNLGMQHMIGPCTTAQWIEFVDAFVAAWRRRVRWAPGPFGLADPLSADSLSNASAPPSTISDEAIASGGGASPATYAAAAPPRLELALWVGPPTIQYARKGMGAERARLWDDIAWARLAPLGFRRMRSDVVTAARQEATWDGLHYAAERGKVQTRHRNKAARVYPWNGGVANMLLTMVINAVCNRPVADAPRN